MGRVRGRERFRSLRHGSVRGRSRHLSVRHSPADIEMPCVAFATPRRLGSAVVRNRLRRRLRAVFADLARSRPELVPPGDYLVAPGDGVSDLRHDELRAEVVTALEAIAVRRDTVTAP